MGLERGVALPFILLQAIAYHRTTVINELDVPRPTWQGLTLKEGRGRRS